MKWGHHGGFPQGSNAHAGVWRMSKHWLGREEGALCVSMRQHGTFEGTEDARVPGMTGEGESDLREKDSLTAPALAAV